MSNACLNFGIEISGEKMHKLLEKNYDHVILNNIWQYFYTFKKEVGRVTNGRLSVHTYGQIEALLEFSELIFIISVVDFEDDIRYNYRKARDVLQFLHNFSLEQFKTDLKNIGVEFEDPSFFAKSCE